METYYYVNIFETKGLEYLLLLAFLVLLVLLHGGHGRSITVAAAHDAMPGFFLRRGSTRLLSSAP